jgi:signal peptidase I
MKVLREIAIVVVLVVIVVAPIRYFIAQPFIVDGESMFPTFKNADYLIVDELTYRFSDPKRDDVVIFRYPKDPSVFYIKRIIGLPGETVRIDHGEVTIAKADGTTETLSEPYVVEEDATYSGATTLGPQEYFVMGDNRPRSSDSRVWGVLPRNDMMGRAFLRIFPFTTAGVLPGAASQP